MSTRLVLVRHGQTAWNSERRFQGQADVPLDDVGMRQARAMAPFVASLRPAAIVSSDMARAQQTAGAVASLTGLGVDLDERLREINVGSWSGMLYDEVLAEMPDMEERLARGEDFRRSASGETAAEMTDRVVGSFRDIASRHPGRTTIVVGHGMALRYALLAVIGLDAAVAHQLSGLWNCSWSVLEVSDRWKLLSFNNVAMTALEKTDSA